MNNLRNYFLFGACLCLLCFSVGCQNSPKTEIKNSTGISFRYIPPGEFMMGSEDHEKGREDDESPRQPTKLTKGYYLGATEVTQAQWVEVMGTKPWADYKRIPKGDHYPAVFVSWEDAVEFCKKLSEKESLTFRLPTEAEWEYACRAGTTTEFYWGTEYNEEYAWSSKNAKGDLYEVAKRLPNAWGLFDMGGNAWEWCSDWHGPYSSEKVTDPQGPAEGERKVIRSGSSGNSMWDCRSAERGMVPPDKKFGASSFRILLELRS